jgi:radical SAM superfamily enzyme YgiQ (UPF0313 family)
VSITDFLIINAHRQSQAYRNPTGDWLGIHNLAAFLNENGIRTLAFAGYAHEVVPLLEERLAQDGVRAVGFSCDYENQEEVIRFSNIVRKRWGLPVVVGGPQAIVLEAEFLQRSGAVALVRGEGELTTLELLCSLLDDSMPLASVKGIGYLDGEQFVKTMERPLIRNLDALPFPSPKHALGTLFRPNTAAFLTGRGCPFSCAFCYEGGNSKGVRWRTVDNVMAEVRQVLEERPDIQYIQFTDDTFTVDLGRVREFCRQLRQLRAQRDFCWFCEGHVSVLARDPAILREMVASGMSCLQIGIESGCDEVLEAYNKKTTTAMIEKVVAAAYEAGVGQLWGNIILGGALETQDRIQRSVDFCCHLLEMAPGMVNLDIVYFWPLPGTAITTNPQLYGMRILDPQSMNAVMDFPVVEFEGISVQDFCNIRREGMVTLRAKMRELLPKVSADRMFRLQAECTACRINSLWLQEMRSTEECHKFYSWLACGATALSTAISEAEFPSCYPLRTAHPRHFEDGYLVTPWGRLDAARTAVICQSSGKLDVNAVYERCQKHFHSFADYKNSLLSLEQDRLLTFSQH